MKGAVGGKGVSETGKSDREPKGMLPGRFYALPHFIDVCL